MQLLQLQAVMLNSGLMKLHKSKVWTWWWAPTAKSVCLNMPTQLRKKAKRASVPAE
jgi:hypothetical protein